MPCTEKAKRVKAAKEETQTIWDKMSTEEKESEYELHEITHQMIAEAYPNELNVHARLDKMSDEEYRAFFKKALARLAMRKKKKALARYLRQEGRIHQAEKIEQELEDSKNEENEEDNEAPQEEEEKIEA